MTSTTTEHTCYKFAVTGPCAACDAELKVLAREIAESRGREALSDWAGLDEQYADRFPFPADATDDERNAAVKDLHDAVAAELNAAWGIAPPVADPMARERARALFRDAMWEGDDIPSTLLGRFDGFQFERMTNDAGVAVRRLVLTGRWEVDPT